MLTCSRLGVRQLPAAAFDEPVDDDVEPEVLGVDDVFGAALEPPSDEEPPEDPESFDEDVVAGVEVEPEERESVR